MKFFNFVARLISNDPTASTKRAISWVVVINALVLIDIAMYHGLINGAPLAAVISAMIGVPGALLAAGAYVENRYGNNSLSQAMTNAVTSQVSSQLTAQQTHPDGYKIY